MFCDQRFHGTSHHCEKNHNKGLSPAHENVLAVISTVIMHAANANRMDCHSSKDPGALLILIRQHLKLFKGGSPASGESHGLGERLSPIIGESSKLSPELEESFRGELFNMKEL